MCLLVAHAHPAFRSVDTLTRGKRSIAVHLRSARGVAIARRLVLQSDVLLDPYRPGVLESMGLDPVDLLAAQPRLVVARLTGYGQTGPSSAAAGHDINYLALSGALSMIGRAGERPLAPLNFLADFAGGSLMCAIGVLAALYERARSGRGQIIDAAMVDGAAYLTAFMHGTKDMLFAAPRGQNLLDSGAPFYDTYETSDGGFVAVGALEPHFYAQLLDGLGLSEAGADETAGAELMASAPSDRAPLPAQMDRERWPELRARLAAVFASAPRAFWTERFAASDACVVPVLGMDEVAARAHAQLAARPITSASAEPLPAPRLDRTPARASTQRISRPGCDSIDVLRQAGYSAAEIADLVEAGVVSAGHGSAL